jgi:hypothetical protein
LFAAKSPTFDSRCVRRLVFCVCFLCVGEWLLRPGWLGRGRPAKQLSHCAARGGGRRLRPAPTEALARSPTLSWATCSPPRQALSHTHSLPPPPGLPAQLRRARGGPPRAARSGLRTVRGSGLCDRHPSRSCAGLGRLGRGWGKTAKANALSVQDQTPGLHCAATCLSHTWHRASAALPFASRSARRASKQALLAPCVLAGWLCSGQELRRCLLDHDERLLHNPAPAENASCLSFSCVCVCVCVSRACLGRYFWRKMASQKRETRFPQSPLLKLVRHDPERIDG